MRKGFPVDADETVVMPEIGQNYLAKLVQDILDMAQHTPGITSAQIAEQMSERHGQPSSASTLGRNTEIANLMQRDRAKETMLDHLQKDTERVLADSLRMQQHISVMSRQMQAVLDLYAAAKRNGAVALDVDELGKRLSHGIPRMDIPPVLLSVVADYRWTHGEFAGRDGGKTFYPFLGWGIVYRGTVGSFRIEAVFRVDNHQVPQSDFTRMGWQYVTLCPLVADWDTHQLSQAV